MVFCTKLNDIDTRLHHLYCSQLDKLPVMLPDPTQERMINFCQRWRIAKFSLTHSDLQDDDRSDNDIGLPVSMLVTFDPTARWGLYTHVRMEREMSLILDRPVDLVERAVLQERPSWQQVRFNEGLQRLIARIQPENTAPLDIAQLSQQILASSSRRGMNEAQRNEILQMLQPMQRDEAALLDVARYAQQSLDFVQALDEAQWSSDTRTQAAVLYYIAVIGEAVKRLSSGFRDQHPDIPWADIDGTCDKVIHQYDRIRLDVIWNTVQQDIPELLRLITPLLSAPPE